MSYGYKWFKAEQRYYIGSELPNGDLLKQVREMQPRGHWVRGDEREFRKLGMYTWEPSVLERLRRRLDGWHWLAYSTEPPPLPDLGERE
jgi:hypothetical protein